MLSVNPRPPTRGRGKGTDLRIEYKNSFTNNTNNITNKTNNAKHTKPILSFPELGAMGTGIPPESPGLAAAVDGNRTQECMVWNLGQDIRQDKEQGPLQHPVMDKESETLMIPLFKHSAMSMAWKYLVGYYLVTCLPLSASATLYDTSLAGPK